MGWRVVQQPNGRFAIFSSIVDNFTDINLTDEEAREECAFRSGQECVPGKIQRAMTNPGRWREALETIRAVHGDAGVERVLAMAEMAAT